MASPLVSEGARSRAIFLSSHSRLRSQTQSTHDTQRPYARMFSVAVEPVLVLEKKTLSGGGCGVLDKTCVAFPSLFSLAPQRRHIRELSIVLKTTNNVNEAVKYLISLISCSRQICCQEPQWNMFRAETLRQRTSILETICFKPFLLSPFHCYTMFLKEEVCVRTCAGIEPWRLDGKGLQEKS